jgi:large conductance mechanosensitive channel
MAKKEKKSLLGKTKGFFEEFKKFISKGNIVDLAVAVVIGGAFTKIINSLVSDLIMPLIGLIVGSSDLADYRFHIVDEVYINWGNIVMAVIDFLIVAFLIFTVLRIMVNAQRGISKLSKKEKKALAQQPIVEEPVVEVKPIETTDDILKDIRTLLQAKAEAEASKQDSDKQ